MVSMYGYILNKDSLSIFYPFLTFRLLSFQPISIYVIQSKDKYLHLLCWRDICWLLPSVFLFFCYIIYNSFSPILLGPNREDEYPIQLSETLFREMKKVQNIKVRQSDTLNIWQKAELLLLSLKWHLGTKRITNKVPHENDRKVKQNKEKRESIMRKKDKTYEKVKWWGREVTVRQGKSVKKEERISSRDRLSQFMTSMVEPEILS